MGTLYSAPAPSLSKGLKWENREVVDETSAIHRGLGNRIGIGEITTGRGIIHPMRNASGGRLPRKPLQRSAPGIHHRST